jgi:hypothetical protein
MTPARTENHSQSVFFSLIKAWMFDFVYTGTVISSQYALSIPNDPSLVHTASKSSLQSWQG